jgi:HSP20 family protein
MASMTVTELPDRWVVAVDVPGVAESDIEVTLEDGTLVIEGERKSVVLEGGKGLFNDRSFGRFRRVLNVRDAIDRDGIQAELRDGVLTLTLHRSPEATPRKIAIRSTATTH